MKHILLILTTLTLYSCSSFQNTDRIKFKNNGSEEYPDLVPDGFLSKKEALERGYIFLDGEWVSPYEQERMINDYYTVYRPF